MELYEAQRGVFKGAFRQLRAATEICDFSRAPEKQNGKYIFSASYAHIRTPALRKGASDWRELTVTRNPCSAPVWEELLWGFALRRFTQLLKGRRRDGGQVRH